jgi:hypothetical protein
MTKRADIAFLLCVLCAYVVKKCGNSGKSKPIPLL